MAKNRLPSHDLLDSCRELRAALGVAIDFLRERGMVFQFARELDRCGIVCGVEGRADAAIAAAKGND